MEVMFLSFWIFLYPFSLPMRPTCFVFLAEGRERGGGNGLAVSQALARIKGCLDV